MLKALNVTSLNLKEFLEMEETNNRVTELEKKDEDKETRLNEHDKVLKNIDVKLEKMEGTTDKVDEIYKFLIGDDVFKRKGVATRLENVENFIENEKPQWDAFKKEWPKVVDATTKFNSYEPKLGNLITAYIGRTWARKITGVSSFAGFIALVIAILSLYLILSGQK